MSCKVDEIYLVLRHYTLTRQYGVKYVGGSSVSALRPVQAILRRFSLTMKSSLCASTQPSGTATTFNAEGKEDKFVTNILPMGVYSSE